MRAAVDQGRGCARVQVGKKLCGMARPETKEPLDGRKEQAWPDYTRRRQHQEVARAEDELATARESRHRNARRHDEKEMLDRRRDMNAQQTSLARRDRRAFHTAFHIRSGKKGLFGASIATPLRGTRFEFSALRQRQLTPCRKGSNYGYLRLWRNRTDFRRCLRRCRRSALVCLEPG